MIDFIIAHPVISIIVAAVIFVLFIAWAIYNAGKNDRERQRKWQETKQQKLQ